MDRKKTTYKPLLSEAVLSREMRDIVEADREYIELAIKEAKKSKPEDDRIHPKVGVVIVNGTFVGRAFRGEKGKGDHAEYTALEKKYPNKSMAGATVYVTLEPCTTRNHPKTPCADWLIKRRVGRVVIGMLDPNPQICGKGIHRLRDSNIPVDLFPTDLMAKVEELNRKFIDEYQTDSFQVPSELNRGTGSNLINPRYSNDCQQLDDSNFDLRTVISKETIFIVIGDGLVSTLLDYPVAGMLRDEIDRRGGQKRFRRAVIIGCNKWLNDERFKKHSVLSIGSAAANDFSGQIEKEAGSSKWETPPGSWGAFVNKEKPCVALWGAKAFETREAVKNYIKNPDGLARFLKMCWS